MPSVRLPDGSVRDLPAGATGLDLAASIGRGLAKAAVVVRVDGTMRDLGAPLPESNGEPLDVSIVTDRDPDALFVMRHSTAHVLAQALRRLYGAKVQYTIGPVIEGGFFYDFELPDGLGVDELPAVEAEMRKIVAEKLPFGVERVSNDEAKSRLSAEGQRFKAEIIDELAGKGESTVTLYKQGEFTDLCRGPHVPDTGRIGAFKLQSVAGAYWRGDSDREQLTRIYGTAFFDPKKLDEHLARLEEAKKNDHRALGPKLDLFHLQEEAPGCVFWHDKGYTLWRVVENYVRDVVRAAGYQEVKTPQLIDRGLWERSGHWEKFKDLMFVTESEKRTFALKPMNCPGHIQIFNQGTKSYRDLPLRIAEFGSCHRDEPGGTLHGIMRVRAFTQDDAHIFCTPEQIAPEVADFVRLLRKVYADFGFDDVVVKLATRPEKRIGSDALWDRTEKALAEAMSAMNMPYALNPGEGAFYGPKLEFQIADALGRSWQLGTIQVDPNMPERLGARYVGEDNAEHTPVMLHRAILGSLERFIGILIEQYGGAFPLWLAPVQAKILPISEKFNDYAVDLKSQISDSGLRVEADLGDEKVGAKIRNASLQKVPYMLVVGAKEREAGVVSVRERTGGDVGQMSVAAFVDHLRREVESRGVVAAPTDGGSDA